jgi:DNA-binding NtrC family response regulator
VDPAKVLVVDDERSILLLLKEALSQWGYQVTVASSAAEALGLLKSELFDALITDIRMPDMSGLELLREVKKQDESIEVVMMTGYPTIASAVQALKEGAYDYLSKPLILDELRHLMSRMMERKFLRGEVSTLRARLGEELTVNELIGTSAPMERVKEIIGKVAVTDSPVLIEGESGTGKELVAAAIHRLSSRKAAVHSRQLQRDSSGSARVRVLRPRPRRVLGRRGRRARSVPRRRRGHDLSR